MKTNGLVQVKQGWGATLGKEKTNGLVQVKQGWGTNLR